MPISIPPDGTTLSDEEAQLDALDKKSKAAAVAPTGLENRSQELEGGLDDLEATSQGLTPASAIPPAPSIDANVDLVTPENADIMQGQQLAQATEPLPQKPANSWKDIQNTPGFTNLSPADKVMALHNYASRSRDYYSSLPGADANAIDQHTNDFITNQHNTLFPAPEPDNGIFHNVMAAGGRLGSETIKGVFNALSGFARQSADEATRSPIISKLVEHNVFGVPKEQVGQFINDAADFWKGQAAKVTETEDANPLLSESKGAKFGQLASGLVGPLVLGLPGFIAQHRLQSYGETYNATGDHVKAERAANLASIGDMLFVGQAEGITHGLESVLEKQGVTGIKAWAAKAAAATSGNIGASQLIKAAGDAFDAPAGQRAKAFNDSLNKVDLKDAGIQAAFGLLASGSPINRSKKISAAHEDLQQGLARADEMDKIGLPKAAAAVRESLKADFEQRVKVVDAVPAESKTPASTVTPEPTEAKIEPVKNPTESKEVMTPEAVKTETSVGADTVVAAVNSADKLNKAAEDLGLDHNGADEKGNITYTPKGGGTTFTVPKDATPEDLKTKYAEVQERMKGTPEQLAAMEELKAKRAAREAAAANPAANPAVNGNGAKPVLPKEPKGGDSDARQIESPKAKTVVPKTAPVTEGGSAKPTPASPAVEKNGQDFQQPSEKLLSKWHEKHETELKSAKVVTTKKAAKTVTTTEPAAAKPAKSLVELAHDTPRDLNKALKLPKGATAIRVTDAKGRKTLLKTSDLSGLNPLHEAGPFKKVEAGTIAKGNIFNPIKEEIGLRALPEDENFETIAQRAIEGTSDEARTRSDEAVDSELPATERAHERATVAALREELGDKAPSDLENQVGVNYNHFREELKSRGLQTDSAARDKMLDRVRDDLLENAEKSGNPFTVESGQPYNAPLVAKSKLQDYVELHTNSKRAAEPFHADESTEGKSIEETTPAEEKAEGAVTESGVKTLQQSMRSHVNKFVRSIDLPDSAKGFSHADILKATHLVFDDILQERTGHSLGIETPKLTGSPKWGSLLKDADFRKAVQERVADRVAQDMRAARSRGEVLRSDNLSDEDNAAITKASQLVNDKAPLAQVINSLPDHLREQTRQLQRDYATSEGVQGALRKIAATPGESTEGTMQQAMAAALKTVAGDVPIIVDPTQLARGQGVGIYKPKSGTIGLSPFMSKKLINWAILHETGHAVRYGKIQAFLDGDVESLSSRDRASIEELNGLYQQVLDHADTPEAIRAAARANGLEEQTKVYNSLKSEGGEGVRAHYPLLNLHEFVEGALQDKSFQERLNGIEAPPDGLTKNSNAPATIWTKIKQLLRQLTFGDKGLNENSVLARAFDKSIDIASSGTLENQAALRELGSLRAEPNEDFQKDNENQIKFLGEFAGDHGVANINELAVDHPDLYNNAAELYRRSRVSETSQEEVGLMSEAAEDSKVQDETADRAAGMFKLIDSKNLAKVTAEQIVRDAMTNGASTAEAFSKAFQDAGVKANAADAIGGLVESHFNLAAHEKASEVQGIVTKQAQERADDLKAPVKDESDIEPTNTSIKNAKVDEERAKRGLPSAIKPARKEFGTTWDNAMRRIDEDKDAPRDLVNELKRKARPLTDEENAMLLHRQIELQTDYQTASDNLIKANADGDIATKAEARLKMAQTSDDLLDVYNVGKKAGTEQGRGLATRKMLANEDYSLANMITQKRATLGGGNLNDEQSAEITRLHNKIFELNKKLLDRTSQLDEDASTKQGEDAVDDMRKRVKIKKTAPGDLDAQRQAIIKGMREQLGETGDPADLKRYAQKLAENYIARGIDKLQTVSRAVHEVMKGIAPELTERNVRDMISGYGDYKALNMDAIKVQMRDLKGKLQQASKLDDMLKLSQAPAKTGIGRRTPGDHERRLLKLVNEAKKTGNFTITDPATQLKGALDAIKTRLKNQIKDLGFRLETGDRPADAKKAVEYDAEAEQLKDLRDRIQKTLTDVEGKPELSDEQRIKTAKDALKKQIDDYNRRLEEDDYSPKVKREPISTPELDAMRAERDALKTTYKEFEALEHPERAMERSIAAFRNRAKSSIADYQNRLASGDFAPRKVREPLRLTSDADQTLKADLERAKNEFELGKRKDLYANRTRTEKIADAIAKYGRAVKLTAISTLGKLVLAASHRAATTPVEEIIGSGLAQIPGIKEVAALAPREGGFNGRAEVKAIVQGLTQGIRDSYDVITKGESDLDALYGKKLKMPREWYDWAGGIWHGALKAPIKRAEFERSLEQRLQKASAQGEDVKDPLVLMSHQLGAYKDANAAIFLQDNRVVNAVKRGISALEEKTKDGRLSGLGKSAATTARVLVPILKVPSNYVSEAFVHALGTVSGSWRLARALGKGIDTLHPDEADAIMRHLKKGSLGAAVMLYGFFNPSPSFIQAGGYYQSGEKRKSGDVEAGGLRIAGYDVPKWAAHTPLLEVLQVGATARRVMEERVHGKPKGLTTGAIAGGLGLMEEAPFLEAMMNTSKLKDSPGQYAGDVLKGLVVPAALNNIATWTDRANGKQIKRKPKTIVEQVETGIPGLRQRVPKNPKQ